MRVAKLVTATALAIGAVALPASPAAADTAAVERRTTIPVTPNASPEDVLRALAQTVDSYLADGLLKELTGGRGLVL